MDGKDFSDRPSPYDYQEGMALAKADAGFYGLLTALFVRADDDNLERLRAAFPGMFETLKRRYHSYLGRLPEDQQTDTPVAKRDLDDIVHDLYASGYRTIQDH